MHFGYATELDTGGAFGNTEMVSGITALLLPAGLKRLMCTFLLEEPLFKLKKRKHTDFIQKGSIDCPQRFESSTLKPAYFITLDSDAFNSLEIVKPTVRIHSC